ncbi:MAG: vanadium-dependent haloperoxidase [Gaiellales bacterium]
MTRLPTRRLAVASVAALAGVLALPLAASAATTPSAKLSIHTDRNPGWAGTGQPGLVQIAIEPSASAHRHVVDLYLSTNSTVNKRDRHIGSVALSDGESTTFSYRPGSAPVNPGRFYVLARIRGTQQTRAAASEAAGVDPIARWMSLELNAVQEIGERGGDDPPYEGTRMMALVTTSLSDVNAAYAHRTPYAPTSRPAAGSSQLAALHAAGFAILSNQLPSYRSSLRSEYRSAIAALRAGGTGESAIRAGEAFGRRAAAAILALRANDNSSYNGPYVPVKPLPYVWEPAASGPFKGVIAGDTADKVTPWVIPDVDTVAAGLKGIATPGRDPVGYAAQIEETRTLGALHNTAVTTIHRTAYDTITGPFWAHDAADTYKPYGHLFNIALWIAAQQHNTLNDNARLFGALGAGIADAATSAWHQKFAHDQPRPYFVIQSYAATDGIAETIGDPNWKPLIKPQLGGADGPPFPDYVSGHSTMAGAWGAVMTRFAAQQGWKHTTFRVGSEEFPQMTRVFDGKVRSSVGYDMNAVDSSYRSMALEDAYSRLPAGVHTRGATRDGYAMGTVVAGYAISRFLG